MMLERQVYLLDPQLLPPETIAVTFAKTSRSPDSFRQIAEQLTNEKSAEFHEKWVVGYGHSSVAEHAVLHVAVENISRLAVEALESNRLASYTEKSTRYQTWDPESFYIPKELDGHPELELYVQTCRNLFNAYHTSLDRVRAVIAADYPPKEGESEAKWDRRIRSRYVDVCRFFLPAASLANVGMTINARALEHCISKMLSDPLEEVRTIGHEVKQVAQAEVPTLVKYADALPYLHQVRISLEQLQPQHEGSPSDWCTLVSADSDGDLKILAAALYRFHPELDYTQASTYVRSLSQLQRQDLAQVLLGELGKHDIPLRELEYASYSVDLILDQGAYFELKRHRMMTQTPQPLTPHLGYAVPRKIVEAGLEEFFHNAMKEAHVAYDAIAQFNPNVAAYLVPNAYNRRVLMNFNLRSAIHLIQLRAAENAHFSIRRAACRIADLLQNCNPLFGKYLASPIGETWQEIENRYFVQVQ